VDSQARAWEPEEHSRHRSLVNFVVNVLACLVAYSYQEKKPSLDLRRQDLLPLFQ
jgi:hypothetical protein